MMYFECTDWAFITFYLYLGVLFIVLLSAYIACNVKGIIIYKSRKILVCILSLTYVCVVYYSTFAYLFFGIKILPANNAIEIIRLFPERITAINMSNILEVKSEIGYKGFFKMIIKTKDGKTYEGAPSNRTDVDSKTQLVKAALP